MTTHRWSIGPAVLLLVLGLAGQPAAGHAVLMDSSPKARQVLDASPKEVSVTFNESVGPIYFRVLDRGGREVGAPGEIRLDGTRMIMSLGEELPRGTYVLTYRVISADTHPVGTTFAFSVGEAVADTSSVTRDTEQSRSPWSWAVAANRWVLYAGMLLAAGSALFLLLLSPTASAATTARNTGRIAALAGLVAYVLSIGFGGAEMVLGGAGAIFSADTWARGVASTLFASMVIGLPSMALLAWAFGRPMVATTALGVGVAGAVGSFLVTGHAATAPPAWLMATIVGVHLFCTALWMGSLLPLARSAITDPPAESAALMTRFSRVAVYAVTAIVVSGVVISWVQLGSPAKIVGSDYGGVLVAKLLLFVTVLALAAWNKLVLTPALDRGDAGSGARMQRSIRIEALVYVLVVGAAMGMTMTIPPRAVAAAAALAGPDAAMDVGSGFKATVQSQGYSLDLEVTPARAGDNMIMATVRDAQGAPIPSVVSVEVIASLQAAGIEEVRVRGEPVGNGMWHATVSDMVIPGDWKLVIDAFVTDYDKVTFESQVTIR